MERIEPAKAIRGLNPFQKTQSFGIVPKVREGKRTGAQNGVLAHKNAEQANNQDAHEGPCQTAEPLV